MRAWRMCVVVVLVVLEACTASGSPSSSRSPSPSPGGSRGSPLPLAEALRACPVTAPNGSSPPGIRDAGFFGGGGLWTVLWPHGLVVVPPDDIGRDGRLGMKFPWWRGPGVRGFLRITGAETGSGLPVTARTEGYGRTGFNASGIYFPGEGCYRVTGRAGQAEITFVTLVRTCSVVRELPASDRRRYGCTG